MTSKLLVLSHALHLALLLSQRYVAAILPGCHTFMAALPVAALCSTLGVTIVAMAYRDQDTPCPFP